MSFFVIRNFGTLGLVVDILTYEEKKVKIRPILRIFVKKREVWRVLGKLTV